MDITDVLLIVGEQKKATEEHGKQLERIFEVMGEVKTSVDQNLIKATNRDAALLEVKTEIAIVKTQIQNVDKKIENGIRKDISELKEKVFNIFACIDKRKQERDGRVKGFIGYFKSGFIQFREKSSFYVVGGGILLTAWFLFWALGKMAIFHEGPEALLKLFGIGG